MCWPLDMDMFCMVCSLTFRAVQRASFWTCSFTNRKQNITIEKKEMKQEELTGFDWSVHCSRIQAKRTSHQPHIY